MLKVTLKAPAPPAIFFLFPRTRHPALLGGSFAEELLELPVLPGQTGTLLPEKWEPLKAACFPKQMPHKNDRAVLTRLPHPVRKNCSACFITEIFELEMPSKESTYGARSTHMASNVCVCAFSRLCVYSRTCLLECTFIPQSARPCSTSARLCHHPRTHQAVAHHMYCALFCHCICRSQISIKA